MDTVTVGYVLQSGIGKISVIGAFLYNFQKLQMLLDVPNETFLLVNSSKQIVTFSAFAAISMAAIFMAVDHSSGSFSDDMINNVVNSGIENNTLGKLSEYDKLVVTINGYNISAFIADTNEKRTNGLSRVENLDKDQGMLFVFDYPSKQEFWMKEMNFPIDIIWINDNYTVIHIERSLEPCVTTFMCPLYSPSNNAKYVLETSAGFAESHLIDVGSKAVININASG